MESDGIAALAGPGLLNVGERVSGLAEYLLRSNVGSGKADLTRRWDTDSVKVARGLTRPV